MLASFPSHLQTREWKEGLVSVTFRDFSNNATNKHQWIVLDGDIDAGGRRPPCGTLGAPDTLTLDQLVLAAISPPH
jgi:hypothetical protein